MRDRKSKLDYPVLMEQRGREFIESELSNEYTVGVDGGVAEIKFSRLGLDWMMKQANDLQSVLHAPHSLPDLAEGDRITIGELSGFAVGSPAWHAANIRFWMLMLIQALRSKQDALSLEDMDKIIDPAVRLGATLKEFVHAKHFSGPLLSALKRRESLRVGREGTNAKKRAEATAEHNKWKTTASQIWRQKPRLSIVACAKAVITHHRLESKVKTVADQIRDLKPKKVGETG
jgi:hypothetical protein